MGQQVRWLFGGCIGARCVGDARLEAFCSRVEAMSNGDCGVGGLGGVVVSVMVSGSWFERKGVSVLFTGVRSDRPRWSS
jgi:hypothetical protein